MDLLMKLCYTYVTNEDPCNLDFLLQGKDTGRRTSPFDYHQYQLIAFKQVLCVGQVQEHLLV